MELYNKLSDAIRQMEAQAPAQVCLTCANFDPGIQGGCFLRLQPKLDTGLDKTSVALLFSPIEESQPLDPGVVQAIACEGYNSDLGYPDNHPLKGGWVCWDCGRYMSVAESVDSQRENLPSHLQQCSCGGANSYYAV